ncbi:MAG TPA: 50S ribosomal protein L11 methyltransferase [Lacibacter sp.]|nr:50S ribosomal protein L11 methyltransferase [Lacibacter sp.]HMO90310.1 50S ribosomal protein L11 methyltransferase [Lacibacter sp.]HMP87024.1 50S ribosomal protein L11 methyltransferase [Lacibacter sp.]
MQHYIQVTIRGLLTGQAEILIALLSEAGFEGFEEGEDELKACIPQPAWNPGLLEEVVAPFACTCTTELLPPRNWNAEWEQQYQPVIVDGFAGVRAHFHPPLSGVEYEIIITPQMSFGTGHHATTWQMLWLMRELDLAGKTVFDFGAGTGVLAILAEKRGTAAVLAMDIDDWCIENALENAERNHCTRLEVIQGDAPPADRQFDCILANINRHILLQHMPRLANALVPGGHLLISGFYADENNLLVEAAANTGLALQRSSQRDNWSCLQLKKIKPL